MCDSKWFIQTTTFDNHNRKKKENTSIFIFCFFENQNHFHWRLYNFEKVLSLMELSISMS